MSFSEPGDYVDGTCLMDLKVEFNDGTTGDMQQIVKTLQSSTPIGSAVKPPTD